MVKTADKISDQKLVKLIAKDNELAFTQLFDKYWKSLSNAAYKVLKDRDAAHDIVQDIFINLWAKRKSVDIEHVSSYLHTAVKYRVINCIHKNEVPMLSLDFVDGFKNLNSTEELMDLMELDEVLKKSVEELPEQCRKIFRMSRFDYMSNKEIAQQLHLSVRTVENHIANALRLLRPKVKHLIFAILFFYYL